MEYAIFLTRELWRFCTDPHNEGIDQQWCDQDNQPYLENKTRIIVPSCWNRKASRFYSQYNGIAWYWRNFRIPKSFSGKKVSLNFASIANKAKVYIDSEEIGEFSGSFIPFKFDVSKFADNRSHFLSVRIEGIDDTNRYHPIESIERYYGIIGQVFLKTEDTLELKDRSMETIIHFGENPSEVKYAELTFSLYLKNNNDEEFDGKIRVSIERDYVQVVEEERPIKIMKQNSRLSKIILHINKYGPLNHLTYINYPLLLAMKKKNLF